MSGDVCWKLKSCTRSDLKRRRAALKQHGRGKDAKMAEDVRRKDEDLEERYKILLEEQRGVMPGVLDAVGPGGRATRTVYMPSAIPESTREGLGMKDVADREVVCRKELAISCVLKLREVCRILGAVLQSKIKNDRGQEQNTRANQSIESTKRVRDCLIADYNRHRRALIKLGAVSELSTDFRELKVEDCFRRTTTTAGNSRYRDGTLWTQGTGTGALEEGAEDEEAGAGIRSGVVASVRFGTSQSRRRALTRGKPRGVLKQRRAVKEDGWIWEREVEGQTDDGWSEERE